MADADESIDVEALDLERYDFTGLRADMEEILDLPGAIGQVIRRSLWLLGVGAVIAWLVFDRRMPLWALVPYMILVVAALAFAAVALGVVLVLRERVAQTDQAADRALHTLAVIHGDYLRVRSGQVRLPMPQLASMLTRELVFPVLLGGGSGVLETAATTTGPMGWVAGPVINRAMGVVESRLLAALDTIDPTELGSGAVDAAAATAGDPASGAPAADLWASLDSADLPAEIERWYRAIHANLSRVVDGVGVVAVGGAGATAAFAVVPLLLVLALGWVLS